MEHMEHHSHNPDGTTPNFGVVSVTLMASGGGSKTIMSRSCAEHIVRMDPSDESGNRRQILCTKVFDGERPQGLVFHIESETRRLAFAQGTLTSDGQNGGGDSTSKPPSPKVQQAIDFLHEQLAGAPLEMTPNVITDAGSHRAPSQAWPFGRRIRITRTSPKPRVLPGDGKHAVGCSPRPAAFRFFFLTYHATVFADARVGPMAAQGRFLRSANGL